MTRCDWIVIGSAFLEFVLFVAVYIHVERILRRM
jgi:hypothetical protein